MPSLQRHYGSSHRRPLMVPISMRNITRASQLAPGTLLIQHLYSLERPRPSRRRPPKLRLQPRLARPIMPTLAPVPMTYEDLLPSLIANQMAVISPGKIY